MDDNLHWAPKRENFGLYVRFSIDSSVRRKWKNTRTRSIHRQDQSATLLPCSYMSTLFSAKKNSDVFEAEHNYKILSTSVLLIANTRRIFFSIPNGKKKNALKTESKRSQIWANTKTKDVGSRRCKWAETKVWTDSARAVRTREKWIERISMYSSSREEGARAEGGEREREERVVGATKEHRLSTTFSAK